MLSRYTGCVLAILMAAVTLNAGLAQASQDAATANHIRPLDPSASTTPMTPMILIEPHHAHEHESFYAALRHAVLVLVIVALAIPVAHFALRPRIPQFAGKQPLLPIPLVSDASSSSASFSGMSIRSTPKPSSTSGTEAPLASTRAESILLEAPPPLSVQKSRLCSAETFIHKPLSGLPTVLSSKDMSPTSASAACAPPAATSSALVALRWLSNLVRRRRARYGAIPAAKPPSEPQQLVPQPQPPPASSFLHRFQLAIPHLSSNAPLDDPVLGLPFRVSLPYSLLVFSLAVAIAAPFLVCISMTFRFRKGGDLHADLQWAVHSLTWLATWCLLPLAYFDAEALSGRVWAAHAAGAGLGGSGTLSGPASVWAARLDASGRVEPETSSVRQLSAGVRQRYVTAPASSTAASASPAPSTPAKLNRSIDQNPVNPPPMPRPPPTRPTSITRSRLSETLGTLVPIYALTLVFFTLVPYSLFASVTQILLIGYALITLAPLGVKLGLRPVVATLANPDAAFPAAVDAAKAECERLEAAISVVDVRIMAAESEVGIERVLRERAEEDKRERPVSEPDSGVGVGDEQSLGAEEMVSDLLPTRAQEGAGHPGNGAGTKPRLPKLIISTESSKPSSCSAANDTDAAELAAIQALSPTIATSSSLSLPRPPLEIPASPISRTASADLTDHILRPITPLSATNPSASSPLSPASSARRRTVSSPDTLPTASLSSSSRMPLDSRAARRVRDMHRSRTKLLAAHANALAALAHVPVRFAYRRGWMARTCAGCALVALWGGLASAAACSLGLGTCYAASLFCASSVLAMLIVRGLVATVVGDRAPVSRAAVVARVLRVVVVCGALGEAVEVIVLGPWVACGRLGGSDTWLGKVVVPAVLVGGFWLRVGFAIKESVGVDGR